MEKSINKRNWWVVLVGGGFLAIAVWLIQQNWLPDYDFAMFIICLFILGIAFYWVYSIDREGLWWALIPTMAMVVLLATGIVAYFTPKDASGSSPYGVVTMGLGAAIMGIILKRPTAKFVLFVIAIITLLVGFLMLPLDLIWKIFFIVLEIALIGYLIWQSFRKSVSK
ncbi:MAG: hypothetical protein C3F13_13255 [Anaerolineales bacterium]|nr:hypothetical protein [Anaerolineae bacterium]PWB51404.1 MAG: hypothetical protein C3F13_13255 [Anaerolineales bacterium]